MKKVEKIEMLTGALDSLTRAVQDYKDERDSPAPDFTMRKIRYDQMISSNVAARTTLERVAEPI